CRMMPAQAVPWPILSVSFAGTHRTPIRSVTTSNWARTRPAKAGCVPSTPLSSTAILTPLPVPAWNACRSCSKSTIARSADDDLPDGIWAIVISLAPVLDQRADEGLHDTPLSLG